MCNSRQWLFTQENRETLQLHSIYLRSLRFSGVYLRPSCVSRRRSTWTTALCSCGPSTPSMKEKNPSNHIYILGKVGSSSQKWSPHRLHRHNDIFEMIIFTCAQMPRPFVSLFIQLNNVHLQFVLQLYYCLACNNYGHLPLAKTFRFRSKVWVTQSTGRVWIYCYE